MKNYRLLSFVISLVLVATSGCARENALPEEQIKNTMEPTAMEDKNTTPQTVHEDVNTTPETVMEDNGTTPSTSIEELPENYTMEMAKNNGDYLDVHGRISNEDVMNGFIENVSKKEDAFVRTVRMTIEGDPIITDFSYRKGKFKVIVDTTRD